MSMSTVGSPSAAAMRSIVSEVSSAGSPLASSTSPTRMHTSSTCCTWASDGTAGPTGRSRSSVGGPPCNRSCASRRTAPRNLRVRRPMTGSLADAPCMPQAACSWRAISRSASSRDSADGGEPHIRRPFGSCRNQTETHADDARDDQVVGGPVQVAGRADQRTDHERGGAGEQRDRHVERDRQAAAAHLGREQRRQRRGHRRAEADQQQAHHQQPEEDRDPVSVADQQDHREAPARPGRSTPTQAIGLRPTRSESMPSSGISTSATTITTIWTTCEVVDGAGSPPCMLRHGVGDVGRHVGGEHVVGDVPDQHQAHADEQERPQRRAASGSRAGAGRLLLALLGLALQRGERRGVGQPGAQVDPDEAERQRHEERDPPAPGQQLVLGERGVGDGDDDRAEEVAGERAELQPAAEEAAACGPGRTRR